MEFYVEVLEPAWPCLFMHAYYACLFFIDNSLWCDNQKCYMYECKVANRCSLFYSFIYQVKHITMLWETLNHINKERMT